MMTVSKQTTGLMFISSSVKPLYQLVNQIDGRVKILSLKIDVDDFFVTQNVAQYTCMQQCQITTFQTLDDFCRIAFS